ncbi:MAG: hypothetical protein AB7E52_00075 [Bdellovibrionales bacterium]
MTPLSEKKASINIEKLAQNLLKIMQVLTAVMEREIDMLEHKQYEELERVRGDKYKAMRDYETAVKVVSNHRVAFKTLPAEVRQGLREAELKMKKVGAKNKDLLRAAIEGTHFLLQTVVKAAQKRTKMMDSYDDLRKRRFSVGDYSPKSLPVAVDRNA